MKNKLKAIGILFILSLTGYGIAFVTSLVRVSTSTDSVEVEASVKGSTKETVTEVVFEDLEPVEGICPECEEEYNVLGDTTSDICESVFNEEITTPVFIDASGNVDYKDGSISGDVVRKDAKIKIVEINVPAVLLAGSYQVEDSNQLISMDSAANPSAGGNLPEEYGRKLESPVSAKDYDEKIENAVYKEPFGSETEMKYEQSEQQGPVAKINIKTTTKAVCENCQDSNYNPSMQKESLAEVNETLSIPGGQQQAPQNEVEYINPNNSMVEELPEAGEEVACKRNPSGLEKTVNLFKTISSSIFNRCNMVDENGELLYPDECIRVEDIVIRTNSFFGDYESCKEEGKCINTFEERRILTSSSPVQASDFDYRFTVKTRAKVEIDGETYDVWALWDVSYISYEYYYQWQNHNPGEEFPEWSVYWEAIEKDLEKRASTKGQTI